MEDQQTRPPKLLINVADLRRRLGQRRSEPIDITLARQTVAGSRTTSQPVRGEVTIESIERGVSVTGAVTFGWEGDCRRCLEVTGDELQVDIDEIFQIDAAEDSELLPLAGDQIDLVPIVRDAVLLSLPLAPLCGSDCAGPDPDRYPAITADESERLRAAETKERPDPRWAALDQLKLDEN
jgi:uncharacterized protein